MLPVYVLGEIALATLITWVYNETGGSLLVGGIILHNADNFWSSVIITDETMASAFQGAAQTHFDMQLYLISIAVTLVAVLLIAAATHWKLGYDVDDSTMPQ